MGQPLDSSIRLGQAPRDAVRLALAPAPQMGPLRQPTGHRGGAEGDPIQLPSRHPLWLTGLGKEDREETWPRINPSATREAEENLKMDPSPFLPRFSA
jgi:hypothetical protein